jgi:hypothetical protein
LTGDNGGGGGTGSNGMNGGSGGSGDTDGKGGQGGTGMTIIPPPPSGNPPPCDPKTDPKQCDHQPVDCKKTPNDPKCPPPCDLSETTCPLPQCPTGTHREGNVCVRIVNHTPTIRIIHMDVTRKFVTIERIVNNVPVIQTVQNIIIPESNDNPMAGTRVQLPTVNFVDANTQIGHMVGTIKNNGNTQVKIVNILATLKDRDGGVLSVSHGIAVANKLKQGESTIFEIQILQTTFRISDIKSVVFHLDVS